MSKIVGFVLLVALGITLSGAPHSSLAPTDDSTVDELSWLAGSWGGRLGDVEMEEYWLVPRGGIMLGLHRDIFDSGRVFFEYLRIEKIEGRVVYLASPRGRAATPFFLKERSEQRVVFENPEHDFPQRIIYWLDDEQVLHARIEGEENGKPRASEWRWKRFSFPSE